ncbi:MAG: hypothetical protein KDD62_02175, partial [Bdellovibrionales bacterium]|nr:hypothetical protein [Bdellovibrionales bacterium]
MNFREIQKLTLPIAVDVMGSDLGASVVIEGAVDAAQELGIPSLLVGRQHEIEEHLSRLGALNHDL